MQIIQHQHIVVTVYIDARMTLSCVYYFAYAVMYRCIYELCTSVCRQI